MRAQFLQASGIYKHCVLTKRTWTAGPLHRAQKGASELRFIYSQSLHSLYLPHRWQRQENSYKEQRRQGDEKRTKKWVQSLRWKNSNISVPRPWTTVRYITFLINSYKCSYISYYLLLSRDGFEEDYSSRGSLSNIVRSWQLSVTFKLVGTSRTGLHQWFRRQCAAFSWAEDSKRSTAAPLEFR